ncbi:MAG: 23S rRNA (guanosine(2251)-2'-O)-methyltransferase RlmB [Mycoplasma sp.]|nr:23S rRNA (guanosine(2251)-2'-O)-methyltransferase RlmB [Mycoplasma sp.]
MGKIIIGKNSVLDAIENELPIKKVYTSDKNIKSNKFEIIYKNNIELNKISNKNHQGYILELQEFNYSTIDELIKSDPKRVLILDHIQDPQNFGSILRSANAFGVKFIIFPKNRQVDVTDTVLKVSSGGFVGLKLIKVTNISRTISILKEHNYWIYASTLSGNSTEISKVEPSEKMVFVIGNEEKGVSQNVVKNCDFNFHIEMYGTVQSLNAAVATAIILFNFAKI